MNEGHVDAVVIMDSVGQETPGEIKSASQLLKTIKLSSWLYQNVELFFFFMCWNQTQ